MAVGLLLGCWPGSMNLAAQRLPTSIESNFQKIYPKATGVEWTQMAGCYVASFLDDDTEIDVWFSPAARWVMTENDVESLEMVPPEVAEAFRNSPMAGMRLTDVRIVTFPGRGTVIVIEVEPYNSVEEFQLFYSEGGTLQRTLNVTGLGGEIYPGLFE